MRYKIGKFLLLVGIVFNVSAEKINLSGKVSNLAGKPIAKAIVTLIKQGLKDTTDSNGLFAIVKDEVSVLPYLRPSTNRISINRDYLMLSLMTPSKVRIEIFDVSGKFLKREILQTAEAGFYNYNIGEYSTKSKLLLIKVGIGTYETTIRYIPLNNKNSVIDVKYIKNNLLKENKLSKIMAIDDTLEVKATSYQTKK